MSLSDKQMSELCHVIMTIIYEKGFKSTTMDLVAAELRISKRTLYEIFESKTGMLAAVIDHLSKTQKEQNETIVREAPNMLVAIMRIFNIQRQRIANLNVNFFRDMDRLYQTVRPQYEKQRKEREMALAESFRIGIEQGLFRSDLNYLVIARMLEVQMESLKRMEELFPPDLSILECYDSISLTFLRGILTPKGLDILENSEEAALLKSECAAINKTDNDNTNTIFNDR